MSFFEFPGDQDLNLKFGSTTDRDDILMDHKVK